ncbi:MAG TPA: hypothetical protein VE028_10020 [Nitratidesulfovibrio sp.]|nr:hypothetical protein [Nitratidesulfovibrio sp.]
MKKEAQQNHTDYILAVDYFDYVYSALHIQRHHKIDFEHAEHAYMALEKFHDHDGFTLGLIIYALKSIFEGQKHTYEIEKLSHEQFSHAETLLQFLYVYGYKIHDIIHLPTGAQIAQAILTHQRLPQPPIRFPISTDKILSTFSSLTSNTTEHIAHQDQKDELSLFTKNIIEKLQAVETSPAHKDGARVKAALIQAHKNSIQKLKKNAVTPQKQETFSQKRKQLETPSYRGYRSTWERIIGLILWELGTDAEEMSPPLSKIWTLFRGTDIYTKMQESAYSTEAESQDYGHLISLRAALEKDERSYRRWVEATIESVKAGKYIAI